MLKENAKYNLVSKGVKALLEEAKVPLKLHLKVAQELRTAFDNHTKDRAGFTETLRQAVAHLQEQKIERSRFNSTLSRMQQLPHLKGEKGDRGSAGVNGSNGADGTDGKDGVSPNLQTIVRALVPYLPKPKDGKDGKNFELKDAVEAVLKELQKGDKLHISHVKGAAAFMKDGIRYRFEELMHGAGNNGRVTRSYDLSSQCDGLNKTFTIPSFSSIITLIATDAPIIYRPTVDFTATGTTLTLTAAVNAPSSGATLMLTYL